MERGSNRRFSSYQAVLKSRPPVSCSVSYRNIFKYVDSFLRKQNQLAGKLRQEQQIRFKLLFVSLPAETRGVFKNKLLLVSLFRRKCSVCFSLFLLMLRQTSALTTAPPCHPSLIEQH